VTRSVALYLVCSNVSYFSASSSIMDHHRHFAKEL
jgi:hypothetical protein